MPLSLSDRTGLLKHPLSVFRSSAASLHRLPAIRSAGPAASPAAALRFRHLRVNRPRLQSPAAAPAAMPRYCRLQAFRLWPCHRRLQLRRLQVSGLRPPRRQCRNAVRAATAESSSWRPLTLPSHGKAPPGCGHTPFRSASGADVPPPAPSPSRRA